MSADPVSMDDARRRRDGRIPPNNMQAEESLLGAMLLRPDAIAAAVDAQLSAEDFYKPVHAHIYDAIVTLYSQGAPADPITVAESLNRAGMLEGVGGQSTLITLQTCCPSIGNAGRYARIIVEHSTLRKLIKVAGDLQDLGYSLPEDVQGALDEAEQAVFGLRRQSQVPEAHALKAVLVDWLGTTEARFEAGGAIESPMGWADLDAKLGGLHPGRLVIVAARPGVGKTSWAGNLATNVAGQGAPVLFVSIEMGREELAGRMVASASGLVGSDMGQGKVAPNDWARIATGMERLGPLPIDIVDTTPVTLLSVRAGIRRAIQRRGRLGLVIIDYVQLMSGRGRAENRQVEVAEVVRGLKLLSKEMAVPVLALAQLSRNLEQRADKRPTLADLRESGELENSADQVVFIYRDEVYDPRSTDRGIAELIIEKNRHGPRGTVRVSADMASGRWNDLTRREEI